MMVVIVSCGHGAPQVCGCADVGIVERDVHISQEHHGLVGEMRHTRGIAGDPTSQCFIHTVCALVSSMRLASVAGPSNVVGYSLGPASHTAVQEAQNTPSEDCFANGGAGGV